MDLFSTFSSVFWGAFIIVSFFIVAASDNDAKGWAYGLLAVFTLAFYKPILGLVLAVHWQQLAFLAAGYLFIGAIWTIVKWWLHIKRIQTQIASEAAGASEYRHTPGYFRQQLQPSWNKSKIIFWGLFWPWSVLWTSTHDAMESIFNTLRSVYERMAKGALVDLETLESKSKK